MGDGSSSGSDALTEFLRQLDADLNKPKEGAAAKTATRAAARSGFWKAGDAVTVRQEKEELLLGPIAVRIIEDPTTRRYSYEVEEPSLSPVERGILHFIEETLMATLRGHPGSEDHAAKKAFLDKAIEAVVKEFKIKLAPEAAERIAYFIASSSAISWALAPSRR
jgi:hypothetical protein